MKIIAINGSARKNWNTSTLLKKALEGAEAAGAETELINLYDLEYKGCISCMACKVKNGKSLGRCAVNDGLKPVLDAIDKCDGLILGSPIYFGNITGMMRSFWERLIFQYLSYDDYSKTLFNGKMKTAFIYTMNGPEAMFETMGYAKVFEMYESTLKMHFKNAVSMMSTETLQVADYSKYHMASFNEADRKKRREEVFPMDCKKAYELGKSIATA
ncbi:flavodoxin family protein [Clostridium sp. 19966]|uniref:flavodoxin family protein n=1 Tax=Clostridium sp. 19966 TaxID=2768166 RepID=UPI0028DDDBAD|nr:flavodoxin family protein [Clostridium sp. 19966]MDT8719453.1 flavodoxin family protein [Clostridium sp. 19966]